MRVSILAYDGCMGAEVLGFSDVLLVANRLWRLRRPQDAPPFTVTIVGARAGSVQLAGGSSLGVAATGDADLLVVPAFDLGRVDDIDAILAALQAEQALIRQAVSRHPVSAICGAGLLLGEAGVLDGRRATTAWTLTAEMARRYPAVTVLPDALVVEDGPITTSGAFTAYGDLALRLIRDRVGDDLAGAVARFSLMDSGRTSQAPYFDARMVARRREPFSRAVSAWLQQRLAERYDLETLARAFNLSSRTLLRRFKAETNSSPLDLLQDLRLDRAKRLLEGATLSIAQIAAEVGYQDLSTFSRLFSRRVSVPPAAYRKRFRPGAGRAAAETRPGPSPRD